MKYKTAASTTEELSRAQCFAQGSTCFLITQANNTTITSKVTQKQVEQKGLPLLSSMEHTVVSSRQTLVMVVLLFCSVLSKSIRRTAQCNSASTREGKEKST